jgi:hypothetical protein
MHSDASALVRIFGGGPQFEKFGSLRSLEVLLGFRLPFLLFSGFCFLRGQGHSPLCMGVPSLRRRESLRWGNL